MQFASAHGGSVRRDGPARRHHIQDNQISRRGRHVDNHETFNSIRDLNLSYLLLAQHMLREDRDIGMFRLGMSGQVSDVLTGLTFAQTAKLASSDQLLCGFRFNDHAMLAALAAPAKHADSMRAHVAILLAGAPAAQFV
jgi:flagellar transcriptional activator FlhD